MSLYSERSTEANTSIPQSSVFDSNLNPILTQPSYNVFQYTSTKYFQPCLHSRHDMEEMESHNLRHQRLRRRPQIHHQLSMEHAPKIRKYDRDKNRRRRSRWNRQASNGLNQRLLPTPRPKGLSSSTEALANRLHPPLSQLLRYRYSSHHDLD